jgi:hypothetical protein
MWICTFSHTSMRIHTLNTYLHTGITNAYVRIHTLHTVHIHTWNHTWYTSYDHKHTHTQSAQARIHILHTIHTRTWKHTHTNSMIINTHTHTCITKLYISCRSAQSRASSNPLSLSSVPISLWICVYVRKQACTYIYIYTRELLCQPPVDIMCTNVTVYMCTCKKVSMYIM